MPSYQVEQYELHVVRHFITRASCAADAIEQVFREESQRVDDCSEFLELANAYGVVLSAEIIEELRRPGMTLFEQRVPSIRSLQEV